MANLIDTSFFIGEINIPNTTKPEVQESLTLLITKYERELLINLLGYELWKSYDLDPTTDRFVKLINGDDYDANPIKRWNGLIITVGTFKFSLIAHYVYYYWLQDKEIWNSGIGTIRATPNQAVAISPGLKMVNAWNEFSRQVHHLYDYLSFFPDIYPEWDGYNDFEQRRAQFRVTNDFDI